MMYDTIGTIGFICDDCKEEIINSHCYHYVVVAEINIITLCVECWCKRHDNKDDKNM